MTRHFETCQIRYWCPERATDGRPRRCLLPPPATLPSHRQGHCARSATATRCPRRHRRRRSRSRSTRHAGGCPLRCGAALVENQLASTDCFLVSADRDPHARRPPKRPPPRTSRPPAHHPTEIVERDSAEHLLSTTTHSLPSHLSSHISAHTYMRARVERCGVHVRNTVPAARASGADDAALPAAHPPLPPQPTANSRCWIYCRPVPPWTRKRKGGKG